jgi:8-oxo-dGTP pyrophosphatase MutT (NUDIX family)
VTGAEVVQRRAARVLALADTGRVLLLRGSDPARPGTSIWHAPGGGVEHLEDDPTAAAREFQEETGRPVALGPLIWDRELDFSFNRVAYHQTEVYFLATVEDEFEPETSGHNELERSYLSGHRWFSAPELREVAAFDLVAPADLADRLDDLLRDGPPSTPVRLLGAVLP